MLEMGPTREAPRYIQDGLDAADHEDRTPAEQAVVNQEEALKSGDENPT
jgi:hypothetical protein